MKYVVVNKISHHGSACRPTWN